MAEDNSPYAFARRAHLRAMRPLRPDVLSAVLDDGRSVAVAAEDRVIRPHVSFYGDHIDGTVVAFCDLCRQPVASSAWSRGTLTLEEVCELWASHAFHAAQDERSAELAAERDAARGPFVGPLEREHLDAARDVLTFQDGSAIVRGGCAMIAVFVGDVQVGEVYVPTTDDAPEAAYRLFEAVRQRVAMEVTRG